MKTDALIEQLADQMSADRAPDRRSRLWARLLTATALSAVPSFFVLLLWFSRSPHLAHGIGATIAFTLAVSLMLAVGAFFMSLALARPESQLKPALVLLPPLAILVAGIMAELVSAPQVTWMARLIGQNPLACFASVAMLSLPILVGTLLILRSGAPTQPDLAGAVAGLLAGGVTMALYVIHCPEDSLLFIAAWHVPAVMLVAAIGAVLGRKILRW